MLSFWAEPLGLLKVEENVTFDKMLLLNAIERAEFMIEENIPIGKEYIDKLKILISNIKGENKRN